MICYFRIIPTAAIVCLLAVATTPGGGIAGVGGPYGEYSMAYQGPETLTLYVVPDGSGNTLDQAGLPYGGTADATVTLLLVDASEAPIASYPAEDMWLESTDGGLVICTEGTIADADTDLNGYTRWLNPLGAGGQSQSLTEVRINGMTLDSTSGINLNFNSPDINGDLAVDLVDFQLFAMDYLAGYSFRSDFHRDGVVNLVDMVAMIRAFGTTCP